MTTEPDVTLECNLFKQLIIAGGLLEPDLEQKVLEWIELRLNCPDPGFHMLGPKLEAMCQDVQLYRDEYTLLLTQYEVALKQQPAKIVELEQVWSSILKKQSDGKMTPEMFEEKKKKLDEWLQVKVNTIKSDTQMLRDKLPEREAALLTKVQALIAQVRKPEDEVDDTTGPADELVTELTSLLEKMDTTVVSDSILTKRTLELGESATPEKNEEQPTIGPTIEQLLPDNQLGDPSIASPAVSPEPVASAPEQPERKKVLIVPPGCEVPIKQAMVDIFAKSRDGPPEPPKDESMGPPKHVPSRGLPTEPYKIEDVVPAAQPTPESTEEVQVTQQGSTGELRAPSCEETATKYIQQLEDGPTKQALMSLCEASLAKVGYHMMCYVSCK